MGLPQVKITPFAKAAAEVENEMKHIRKNATESSTS
jgi:hypothetical protein